MNRNLFLSFFLSIFILRPTFSYSIQIPRSGRPGSYMRTHQTRHVEADPVRLPSLYRLLRLLLFVYASHDDSSSSGFSSSTIDLGELSTSHFSSFSVWLLPLLTRRHDGAYPPRQVRDVLVAALRAQVPQRLVEAQEVRPVEPAGALGAVDVLGERLDVLGAGELVVVRGADVDQCADGSGGFSG